MLPAGPPPMMMTSQASPEGEAGGGGPFDGTARGVVAEDSWERDIGEWIAGGWHNLAPFTTPDRFGLHGDGFCGRLEEWQMGKFAAGEPGDG